MKSSPYVYPFTPFKNLSNKKIRWRIAKGKRVSWNKIKSFLKYSKSPNIKFEGRTNAEKILNYLSNPNIRFGPKSYIDIDKKLWLKQIDYFISAKKPILFTLLGFPFKVPVPLKTNRIYPDMGDVLAINRLGIICKNIRKIYKNGCIIYVFTEGPFGKFAGVPARRVLGYMQSLQKIVKVLNLDKSIRLVDLGNLNKLSVFPKLYREELNRFTKLYKNNDPEYMKRFNGTYPSIYRIVSSEGVDEDTLMDVYNDNKRYRRGKLYKLRKILNKNAINAVLDYHAYLSVRDATNYIQRVVPNSIQLSVSPKRKRIGVIPIEKGITKIPHHAVTVLYKNKKKFNLEYLIDIKRTNREYEPIYVKLDKDFAPFFYIVNN